MIKEIEYLKKCDELYYNGKPLEIQDREYDILKSQTRKNFPDDPYWETVGHPVLGSAVKLPHILGSLNKMKADGSFHKWCIDNNVTMLSLSDKLDGVSIYVKYDDGFLVQASTRGDGYEGKDITDKIRLIHPRCAGGVGVRELRGEAVMTPENCKNLGYSLARSAVAGILNGDDKEHYDKMQYIDLVFYTPLGEDKITEWPHMFYKIEETGFQCVRFASMNVTTDIEDRLVEYFAEQKTNSDWDIDGIVCANYHDTTVGEDYYPSNICAFKVNEDAVECTVTEVVREVKRSGKIQPVVHFDAVNINGSMVRKATGFNHKFIVDNKIGVGSKIGIVKSGDIIPYIVESYTIETDDDATFPVCCPSCDTPLIYSETNTDQICPNHQHCPEQQIYRIEHYLLSHEAEEITATTIRRLGVKSIQDLYDIDEFYISSLEGMGTKKAQTIITQIKKTLKTTQEKLLMSFGISGIGKTASADLINKFGSIEELANSTKEDYKKVDGIGETLASNLWLGMVDNKDLYQFLMDMGMEFDKKESADLQGKLFTLTGKSDINRNDLTKMIMSHGGMVKGISKKIDFLVTDDPESQTGKAKKARTYGTKIISYDELLNIINQ